MNAILKYRTQERNITMKKGLSILLLFVLFCAMTACSAGKAGGGTASSTASPSAMESSSSAESTAQSEAQAGQTGQLYAAFGYEGSAFPLRMEDNETAKEIVRIVGSTDWNLPIYHYDDFENSDVMQYYDIPSRYDIPADPETVTSEKAGEVYYSDPNRILLFYHDAEVTGEYVKIGAFDATEEFISAVEDNPVLEGWGNKIVSITSKP